MSGCTRKFVCWTMLEGIRLWYWSRLDLHLAALELDPSSARSWLDAGVALSTDAEVEFQGARWSREAMLQRAEELAPRSPARKKGTVQPRQPLMPLPLQSISSVRRLVSSSLELQEKACRLQPRSAGRRRRLAAALGACDAMESQKRHGLQLSHLVEAFRLDPFCADSCHQLGLQLQMTGTTICLDGRHWSAESLLARAVALRPQ
ncbi:unnamed protein product, partial [Symbiodinium pilosum]